MSGYQITYANATFTRTREDGARSARWVCDACGRSGLGDDFVPGAWASTCAHGHAACPWCEEMHPVRMDGTPRIHTSCRSVPAEVEASWNRVKFDLIEPRAVVAAGAKP